MLSVILSVILVSLPSAHAYLTNVKMPVCMDGSQEMEIDNARVLDFKFNTKNSFHARGFIQGTLVEAPWRKNKHDHFAISIGPGAKDTIEIVYNNDDEFGPMSRLNVGDTIIVCGDYITSYAKSGGYEASPEGALIHWSHWNPATRQNSMDHEHGFIYFESTLIGFDDAPEAAWDGVVGNDRVNGRNGRYEGSKSHRNGGYDPGAYNGGNRGRKKKRHLTDWEPCTDLESCSERND